MSTVILKNLYRNGNPVKQMFRNGVKIYETLEYFIFSVDTDTIAFEMTGGSETINITCSDRWTIEAPDWITVSTSSGYGNASVVVSADSTEGIQEGEIIITCEEKTHTITVAQGGYKYMPLTFEITGDGYINYKYRGSASVAKTIEYKLNNSGWELITPTSSGVRINVSVGDKVQFRGDNETYGDANSTANFNEFSGTTCQFIVYGNIMSLIDSTDFANLTVLTNARNFRALFFACSGLTSAENLILPATTLTERCYSSLFERCSNLTTAPELPATTLVNYCYNNLFLYCYSINHIRCLATNISASRCTENWVYGGVPSTGTFVTPSTTNWSTGVSGIPSGWTRVNSD